MIKQMASDLSFMCRPCPGCAGHVFEHFFDFGTLFHTLSTLEHVCAFSAKLAHSFVFSQHFGHHDILRNLGKFRAVRRFWNECLLSMKCICVFYKIVFCKLVETIEFEMVVQGKRVCFGDFQQPCSFYVKSRGENERWTRVEEPVNLFSFCMEATLLHSKCKWWTYTSRY